MASKKYYSTQELIDLVESDEFWQADVFITPPDDGLNSEEDSGGENDEENIDHLSGRQLQATATATVNCNGNILYIGEDENDSYDEDDNVPLSELKTKLCPEQNKNIQAEAPIRNWRNKVDIEPKFAAFTPQPDVKEDLDAITCFEYFLDDTVYRFLVEMFTLYAHQQGDHNFEIGVDELKCFVAILLLSGHLQVPRWRMWWETDSDTYNPLVANAMRRNRFEQIKKYVHCADNNNLAPNDKFAKLRPLIDMLNNRFLEYASITEQKSIDESMVPYYGRHGAKQFIKGKPIRYGYKMWCLCEPLGYLINFVPYQGKEENRPHLDLGVGGSVVMTLVNKLPKNLPFKIYGDRYFSSIKLVNRLQTMGIGYIGTIMTNRTERCPLIQPKELKKKTRGTYDFTVDKSTNVAITAWNDNSAVYTVSSCDTTLPAGTVNRWVTAEKLRKAVPQPFVINQYNKFMGVDRMDENIHNYRVSIRSKKWWWPVFAFCLDTCIHNAWQNQRNRAINEKTDYLKFRREIVQVYLKKYGNPVKGGGRPKTSKTLASRVSTQIRFDGLGHWLVQAKKQNRCASCKKNSTKSCEKCGVNLHKACFKKYHVNQ